MTLEEFGFTPWFARQLGPDSKDRTVARITAVHKGWCDLSDGTTTRPAKTTGKLRRAARESKDYLTVGDWVLATGFEDGDFALIHSVLERQNALQRKTVGREVSRQLIAANIDTAFVVHTLDKGFNLPKLERYLSIVLDSQIQPVALLTKRDLLSAAELKQRTAEVKARLPKLPVLTLSNTTGVGLGAVRKLFEPGKTYCLLGASGVGKTSLINALVGEEDRYFTLPVRDSDGKGIHTTTWRELIVLENGALVIDTPGMRELGHLDSANGIQDTFDDITALESACRFRDCTHGPRAKECAVRVAAETGELSAERLANFLRMKEEASAGARALREQRWKNR